MAKKILVMFLSSSSLLCSFLFSIPAFASQDVNIKLPNVDISFQILSYSVSGRDILWAGLLVCGLGLIFGLVEFLRTKALPAHRSMLEVSSLIYETCKT